MSQRDPLDDLHRDVHRNNLGPPTVDVATINALMSFVTMFLVGACGYALFTVLSSIDTSIGKLSGKIESMIAITMHDSLRIDQLSHEDGGLRSDLTGLEGKVEDYKNQTNDRFKAISESGKKSGTAEGKIK